MNFQKACKILDLNDKQNIDIDGLKQQYKRCALKYHPDKNHSIDAKTKFQEISEAYQYLCEHNMDLISDVSPKYMSYSDLLYTFINTIIPIDKDINVIHIIIQKLTHICETKTNDFIDKLDKETLFKIYNIISMNKDIFHINPEYINKIESILNNKTKNDEIIILNPTLDDLFNNNLYRLTIDNNTYIIPLWHHELQYDNNGKDIYVRCNPILVDDIEIDEANDIHVYKTFKIHDLWGKDTHDIELGNQIFTIEISKLKLMKNQTIFMCDSGISRPNIKDIYNISILSTVYIHITLEL